MRRILFFTILCIAFASCQVNELIEIGSADDIYAEIESDVESKTFMDAKNNIKWSEDDQIIAFMQSSLGNKYQLLPDYVGRTHGRFVKLSSESSDYINVGVELNHNIVYYPYADDIYIEKVGDNYALNVTLQSEQTYSKGSFGNGAMPMVAVSEESNITFRNVCGGMKLQLKGTQKITSIKLEGKNNEILAGDATVIAYSNGEKPAVEMCPDASTSVMLDCGRGVQLNNTSVTEFIISLPPVQFSKGFTVVLTDDNNDTYTLETERVNRVLRSSLLIMPVVTLSASGPEYPEVDDDVTAPVLGHNPIPYFSETVELMGMLWRLAGANEYNQCNVQTINNSADSHFASVKNHYAVSLARSYWQQGVRYDAVTGYANQLIFNDEGEIVFDPDYMEGSNPGFEKRWTESQMYDMLAAVNDFYKVSNFHEWFISTESEQRQAITSFLSVCDLDYSWFDSFYGKNESITSRIILSFMMGGNNNGISLKRKDGTFLLTPVLGCLNQYSGNISFNGDMNLIVHEFSHPYCNPLIEKYWSDISATADEVFKGVQDIMSRQAYSSSITMMCETLVRSCAIRYMITHSQKHLVEQTLSYEEGNGFIMVRSLINTLEKREVEAVRYETLEDFMPEIIEAINKFHPDAEAEQDILPHDYVDLGIKMSDGKKLYFATRNVGETGPGGIGTKVYRWGSTIEWGTAWDTDDSAYIWPIGTRLDPAHDIASIEWGGDWHMPSLEEWNALAEQCDYERKEENESGYGVAGYFFYNKADHNKFIFIPVIPWLNEISYWTAEICGYFGRESVARLFESQNGKFGTSTAGISSTGFAVRPVIAASGEFNANGHDYVDLGVEISNGVKLYFATMNVGETSPAGCLSKTYRWGATSDYGEAWNRYGGWPAGTKLDAAHDIATITWGEKWHTPSREEWKQLSEQCDYERTEAYASGYGVAGYFFYNKSDHSKFIFLPASTWSGELAYWSSEISEPDNGTCNAYIFDSFNRRVSYDNMASTVSTGFAIRPVFVE